MNSSIQQLDIAVVGSGISGLSAAWLLRHRHHVTLYEKDGRLGGHSNTVGVPRPEGGSLPVDTGFIVYNERNYPNLVALFRHLGVVTAPSDMSFAVSADEGRFEYSGTDLGGLLAQPANLLRPRFLKMLRDVRRFYRDATRLLDRPDAAAVTLGEFLTAGRYSRAFAEDHLLPMGAAIWSMPMTEMRDYPAASFIRFFASHGLLQIADRPPWRTVVGGSRAYVARLAATLEPDIRYGSAIHTIRRASDGVTIEEKDGRTARFDHVVLATHADQALALLAKPSAEESALLGAFRYSRNTAVLHTDATLMPRRRRAWSSWNYLTRADASGDAAVCVTYWMNRLQPLATSRDYFVTLNPIRPPRTDLVVQRFLYEHPIYDQRASAAQARLWQLQGSRHSWFCGSYFGAGFHEDGLQAGLAVAEVLGGIPRPWIVPNPSGRIVLAPSGLSQAAAE